MMSYCVLASIYLLSLATAQTVTTLTSCLTSDNHLLLDCSFTSGAVKASSQNCTFKTDDKVVASSDEKIPVHSSFKNRAKVTIVDQICRLNMTGLVDDQPKDYTCFIGTSSTKTAKVEKKNLLACSAWSVLQQSGVALLLALLTLPPFSELL